MAYAGAQKRRGTGLSRLRRRGSLRCRSASGHTERLQGTCVRPPPASHEACLRCRALSCWFTPSVGGKTTASELVPRHTAKPSRHFRFVQEFFLRQDRFHWCFERSIRSACRPTRYFRHAPQYYRRMVFRHFAGSKYGESRRRKISFAKFHMVDRIGGTRWASCRYFSLRFASLLATVARRFTHHLCKSQHDWRSLSSRSNRGFVFCGRQERVGRL